MRILILCGSILLLFITTRAAETQLAGTELLTQAGDLSAQMVAGIDSFLMRETEATLPNRAMAWHRDFSSTQAYDRSIQTNRMRLRQRIGAIDPRIPNPVLELVGNIDSPSRVAETARYTVDAVRWAVFPGVFGEGLLVRPKGKVTARLVVLPDADQTPEQIMGLTPAIPADRQFARRLAENGSMMLIPVLISRPDTYSGNARLGRFTNQPHREWIYRQAYELGRHIIGYEVEKVSAAI